MTVDVALMLGSGLAGGFVGWHVRVAYARGAAALRRVRGGLGEEL